MPSFFTAFSIVDLDNNRQTSSLPPYADNSGYTEQFLNEIDVFFVKNLMITAEHLRYSLHILPFLNANSSKFTIVHVPRYGDVYVRKDRVQPVLPADLRLSEIVKDGS